jgi:hypothetical protein
MGTPEYAAASAVGGVLRAAGDPLRNQERGSFTGCFLATAPMSENDRPSNQKMASWPKRRASITA